MKKNLPFTRTFSVTLSPMLCAPAPHLPLRPICLCMSVSSWCNGSGKRKLVLHWNDGLPKTTSRFRQRLLVLPMTSLSPCVYSSFSKWFWISLVLHLLLHFCFLLCLWVSWIMMSKPLQWVISQLTHRGQPNLPAQAWNCVQMRLFGSGLQKTNFLISFGAVWVYSAASEPH